MLPGAGLEPGQGLRGITDWTEGSTPGTAKKKKKVLRLTDTLTPNLPRSASEQRSCASILRPKPLRLPWTCCCLSPHPHLGRREEASP